jgi:hypothetical protein
MCDDAITQRPGPSSAPVIQGPAKDSWKDPIKKTAAESAQQALQNDPRKNPVAPNLNVYVGKK